MDQVGVILLTPIVLFSDTQNNGQPIGLSQIEDSMFFLAPRDCCADERA